MRRPPRAIAFLLLALLPAVMGSCKELLPTAALSPARSLAGTWSTPIAVPMNYQTSVCTGARQNVAKATWSVTWIITERDGTSNGIDVEMRFSRSASTPVSGICSDGARLWVTEVSPLFMTGTISSSKIQLYNQTTNAAFDGNLTTNNITGTFGLWDCQIYCSGEQSEPLKFILTKK